MKKNTVILILSALALALSAFQVISAEESSTTTSDAKSVAWYVANIKEARATNQQCHDNPGMQPSPDCTNALHALEISFKGGN